MNRTWRNILLLTLGLLLSAPAWALGPWHASGQNTYGWPLMTPAERVEYQRQMRSFDAHTACLAYEAEHAARMDARAERRGVRLRPRPVSGCEQLRRQGQFE